MTMTCPSDAATAARIAALRPRGAAWRNGGFDGLPGSVMGQFFDALGAAFGPTDRRLCELAEEFFCATATQTIAEWRRDWGVPDGCDPFQDVCLKVNALGDSTAAYATAAAFARGWAITIREEWTVRAEVARARIARAGAARCGAASGVTWFITVDAAASPAFVSSRFRPARAGRMRAGRALACPPNIEPLKCLIRRIAPAHANLVFAQL